MQRQGSLGEGRCDVLMVIKNNEQNDQHGPKMSVLDESRPADADADQIMMTLKNTVSTVSRGLRDIPLFQPFAFGISLDDFCWMTVLQKNIYKFGPVSN